MSYETSDVTQGKEDDLTISMIKIGEDNWRYSMCTNLRGRQMRFAGAGERGEIENFPFF